MVTCYRVVSACFIFFFFFFLLLAVYSMVTRWYIYGLGPTATRNTVGLAWPWAPCPRTHLSTAYVTPRAVCWSSYFNLSVPFHMSDV